MKDADITQVRFGIFTDLHMDIMHDGKRRFDAFMAAAEKSDVDFIIQLGDFCYPEDTTRCDCSRENIPINLLNSMRVPINVPKIELLRRFNAFEKPSYHVLGNHEFDFCSKQQAMKLYGMEKRYYSFECGGWKFIVLDGNNFINKDGQMADYCYGDYFDSKNLPYIDEAQLKWLEAQLAGSDMPTVLFSHQPLLAGPRGIKNHAQLVDIINKTGSNVRLCINGHIHVDTLEQAGGIYYYTLNSMSNHWMGIDYACKRYSDEIEEAFPNIRYTLPYNEPLYAVITLDENGMEVKGTSGSFVKPTPSELGIKDDVSASIADRSVKWPQAK